MRNFKRIWTTGPDGKMCHHSGKPFTLGQARKADLQIGFEMEMRTKELAKHEALFKKKQAQLDEAKSRALQAIEDRFAGLL